MQHMTEQDYKTILATYPAVITKEQLYRICRVAKRTASYYLESGFIPCVKRSGKTRKYLIQTVDVVDFLRQRERNPGIYHQASSTTDWNGDAWDAWKQFLFEALCDYPDVMKLTELRDMCGYTSKTLLRWYHKERFVGFLIGTALHFPKKAFIEFMGSTEYNAIPSKSAIHTALIQQFKKRYR